MKRGTLLLCRLTPLLGLVAFAQTTLADSLHYNNMQIGDRATGMAGAYAAISDDPSGLYYNPAGVVYAGNRNLSASVNAYNSTSTRYKNVLGGGDWIRESNALLPNFFGVTQPLKKGTLGFSYTVTDSIAEDQDQSFSGLPGISQYIVNINNSDNTYKIGPSYALELNDKLAFGVTLYMHIRGREYINNQWIRTDAADGNRYEWSNLYYQTDETGINPIIGLMWNPLDKLSVGLTLRKTHILNTETRAQTSCISDINASQCFGSINDPSIITTTDNRDLPLTSTLALAYFPSDRLLISGDITHHQATSDTYLDRESVINFAVGTEYYVSDAWALRGGFYTNYANTPAIKVGKINQAEHVDLHGLSLSVSHFTRNSSVSGGLTYMFGSGEAQLFDNSYNIADVEVRAMTLFLSTSYNY